jgi:hypothetical protein
VSTKRQQTMAKITRERAVREKRERKAEKKREAKERKLLIEQGLLPPDAPDELAGVTSAALLDPHEPDGDDRPVLSEGVVPGL